MSADVIASTIHASPVNACHKTYFKLHTPLASCSVVLVFASLVCNPVNSVKHTKSHGGSIYLCFMAAAFTNINNIPQFFLSTCGQSGTSQPRYQCPWPKCGLLCDKWYQQQQQRNMLMQAAGHF
ncbi:hypothetical protein L798_04965 [Zootermopsis nevadensis]|uniref:Uncharacterized protein n=1 Tax=Zootermopsis nevadensis TaxID=136037 RepID=A0A067RLK1_ZOONE|nr:hypothetical protein L798_04965 [Zootermopsis nevadensis]